MTDDTTATVDGTGQPEHVAAPSGAASSTTPSTADYTPSDEVRSLRSEAKQYRLRAKAAEQERDALRTRVDASDRREVERLAADRLQNASDFWLTTQLADLRDEEGGIDADKVSERVEQVLADRPHWRKSAPADFSSGARKPLTPPKTLGAAFKATIGR
jgi:hypothetical protein